MNIIIYYLIFIAGLYLALSSRVVEVSKKSITAISKKRTETKSIFDHVYEFVKAKIINKVNLNDESESQLDLMLKTTGIDESPKDFTAMSYAQGITHIFLGIVLAILARNIIVILPFLLLASMSIKNREKNVKKMYEQIQAEIGKDLPKMCSVISSKVSHTSSVENILKSFYPIANETMKHQLDITIADIQSGNTVLALQRFENRIHSSNLSDITRGLIAVHNGDNQQIYFEVKQQEINKEYATLLEKEIDKRPEKLQLLQLAIVGLFLACVGYPFITVMGSLMGTII